MPLPVPAKRLENLPKYVFVAISERISKLQATGADIIRLDIGNPDMPPDDSIIEALSEFASSPTNHGYSGYRGIPSYREAVARFYQTRFGVAIDPSTEVLPLIGTKEGIVNLSLAYIDQGDVALVPEVGYPSYAMGTLLAGGEIYWIPMPADGYLLDLSAIPIEILSRAKILWMNYPNNPTGAIASKEFYEEMVVFCKENNIILVSDNPYVDITYNGYQGVSALEAHGAKEIGIELFSFSKTYNMAGWRMGAAVGNADILDTLLSIKSNVDSGHFKAIYEASSVALDTISDAWINKRNEIYQKRRDKLINALPSLGLQAQCPVASLYIWAKIPAEFSDDDVEYVNTVLKEAHVSLAPGSAYGPGGKGYVRIALSTPDKRLDIAIERLTEWYSK